MKKLNYILLLFTGLILAMSGSLYAQDSLEVDSFIIVKEYVPTLSQASKIQVEPSIDDTFKLDMKPEYSFLDRHVDNTFKPDTIKAANLKGEPLIKLYRSYIILGYGNYNTPLAEIYFNQLRSKNTSYSINAKHMSSTGVSGIENSGYSNNQIGVGLNRYSRKFTLSGKLNYRYDAVHYYGFDGDTLNTIEKETAELNENIGQFYNKMNAAVSIGNNQRDTIGLRHFTNLSFNYISDGFETSESRIVLSEELDKKHNREIYTLDWGIDYNSQQVNRDSLIADYTRDNTIFYLRPGIRLRGDKWQLHGSVDLSFDFNDNTDIYFYPILDFRYNLIKNIIVPYVGVDGGLKRNSYAQFVEENPFVTSGLDLRNTSEKFTGFAGIRGHMSRNTSFNLHFKQTNYDNMPLYVKSQNNDFGSIGRDQRSFDIVYDDVDVTTIGGELLFEPREKWRMALTGKYFIYETSAEEYAWHKPDYRISWLTHYDLQQKISVDLLIYLLGAQKAKTFDAQGYKTLDGTVDANLQFEYRYTKKISLFLHLNNLASINYEKWQDYPTQGFNVLGGFKFSF